MRKRLNLDDEGDRDLYFDYFHRYFAKAVRQLVPSHYQVSLFWYPNRVMCPDHEEGDHTSAGVHVCTFTSTDYLYAHTSLTLGHRLWTGTEHIPSLAYHEALHIILAPATQPWEVYLRGVLPDLPNPVLGLLQAGEEQVVEHLSRLLALSPPRSESGPRLHRVEAL